jgi:hypothetical protein
MRLHVDPKITKLSPGHARLRQASGPISSLNEAWFCTVDMCFVDGPPARSSFPCCAIGLSAQQCARFSCRRRVSDKLTSDILSFIVDDTQS